MEKVYKTMQRTGAFSIVIGIVVLITGLTVGIGSITFTETQRRYYVLRKSSFCFAKDRNCCFSKKGINNRNLNEKIIPLRRVEIDC